MSAREERHAIGSLFFPEWKAGSNLDVVLPNTKIDKLLRGQSPWVQMSIRTSSGSSIEVGKHWKRYIGMVFFQVFVKEGSGDAEALGYADEISAIFRDKEVSVGENGRILFRTPFSDELGLTRDGWFEVQLAVPFQRDQYFTGDR